MRKNSLLSIGSHLEKLFLIACKMNIIALLNLWKIFMSFSNVLTIKFTVRFLREFEECMVVLAI